MTDHPRYRDRHGRIWEDRDGPVLLTHDPDEYPDWITMQAIRHAYGPLDPVTVPEPTSLHDRIIDIIETEWLRPFDPHDSAGDTPGARAYDAARHVEEAVLDELDRRAANTCKARDARIAELVKERDGLLYTLQHIQATLDRWGRPYAPGHAHNCVHAVAELQNLLNPQEETDA